MGTRKRLEVALARNGPVLVETIGVIRDHGVEQMGGQEDLGLGMTQMMAERAVVL